MGLQSRRLQLRCGYMVRRKLCRASIEGRLTLVLVGDPRGQPPRLRVDIRLLLCRGIIGYPTRFRDRDMAISTEIKYGELDDFSLDPTNPRLGRENAGRGVAQTKVLELMKDWTLDELAVSFLESGFWPQEALLVVKEELYGKPAVVVVEGNRRLAALLLLRDAVQGKPSSKAWAEIVKERAVPDSLFKRVPYLVADSREDVDAFLGFRHVTGIKEWHPAEKASYIAKLIEERKMSYDEVRRKIGSKTPTVRQNYICYRLLLQMEDLEGIDLEHVEDKFSVLYLSLRTSGTQKYLQIDIKAEPEQAKQPVPKDKLEALVKFSTWLFGKKGRPAVVTDSRQVDSFGVILESDEAVKYLERTDSPSIDVAHRIAGGDEPELLKCLQRASDNIQSTLPTIHHHSKSDKIRSAVERFGADVARLFEVFPDLRKVLGKALR